MIRNYIISTLRFFKHNKMFTGINILGLSLALAASFIILLYIINELSYNRSYDNHKQIYRVVTDDLEFKTTTALAPYVMAGAIKDEFPQIEYVARTMYVNGLSLKLNDTFIPVYQAVATDSELFDIFSILLQGSKKDILKDPNSIVLSQSQADKFFPGKNTIGEQITGMINGEEQLFTVMGVFEDFPINSTLRGNCFVNSKWSIEPIKKSLNFDLLDTSWDFDLWTMWVKLNPEVNTSMVEDQFRKLENKIFGENIRKNYHLQNLTDVYLRSGNFINNGISGNMKNIKTFSAIAFLIVLVAAFNYIILSTAVSSGRAKEIGIRKTTGAANNLIRNQLFFESVFMVLLVLPIAIQLAWLGKPYAETLFQKKLYIIQSNIAIYISIYILLAVVIGIVSGLYTSSYLSRLNVISILKNPVISGKRKSAIRFSLIVVQLVIFCSFISGALIVRSQYKFALEKDLGYENKNILLFEMGRNFSDYRAFINDVKSIPEVNIAAGTMYAMPMLSSMSSMVPHFEDQTQKINIEGMAVDYDYIETMGIQIIEGRSFSEDFGSDLTNAILLNETAVKALGITDPIGKQIGVKTIVGIVKDFNIHTIRTDIPPLMIELTDKYIRQVAINYVPGTLDNLLPTLETKWTKFAPNRSFQYQTIEDLIESIYSSEKNLSIIISIFTLFTLIIASFGLFGLTLFIAKTRTKEIGVKKVLGSSEKSIIYSFLRENIKMVFVATIISTPITFYFANNWLNNFSYKTNVSIGVFIIAFLVAVVVVCATVFIHSFRAARKNPVEALRYE